VRPTTRGDTPTENGKPKVYAHYSAARDDLISRIGDYCSYCEMPLPTPAVEHIQPKNKQPEQENNWSNLLLACPSCNSIKKDKTLNAQNLNDYFWPDLDNTFRVFVYLKDSAPQTDPGLSPTDQQIAQNTLDLTGLDREPLHPRFSSKDRRWQKRIEAWTKAERAKTNLSAQVTQAMREQIIDTATSTGFWSVWMTVFAEDIDMRSRIIKAFPGSCINCFDEDTQPIPRPNGQI
jgi:uncharacterized protein (TIGR02646 family)